MLRNKASASGVETFDMSCEMSGPGSLPPWPAWPEDACYTCPAWLLLLVFPVITRSEYRLKGYLFFSHKKAAVVLCTASHPVGDGASGYRPWRRRGSVGGNSYRAIGNAGGVS